MSGYSEAESEFLAYFKNDINDGANFEKILSGLKYGVHDSQANISFTSTQRARLAILIGYIYRREKVFNLNIGKRFQTRDQIIREAIWVDFRTLNIPQGELDIRPLFGRLFSIGANANLYKIEGPNSNLKIADQETYQLTSKENLEKTMIGKHYNLAVLPGGVSSLENYLAAPIKDKALVSVNLDLGSKQWNQDLYVMPISQEVVLDNNFKADLREQMLNHLKHYYFSDPVFNHLIEEIVGTFISTVSY